MELPSSAQAPDTAEVERVFRESSNQVWRAVLAVTAGRVDIADEVTAEAFARALAHAGSIRDPLAWVFRTAFRLAFSEMRRERATSSLRDVDAHEPIAERPSARLVGMLEVLSPQQRAAVFLHYHADLPVQEVARRMGTSTATVKVHLHRGRRRLRGMLENEEGRDG